MRAGGVTPATPLGVPSKSGWTPRSMRAGGVTPATPPRSRRAIGPEAAFNEGRGGYPGDAKGLAPVGFNSLGTFNEGRGGYPGDAFGCLCL